MHVVVAPLFPNLSKFQSSTTENEHQGTTLLPQTIQFLPPLRANGNSYFFYPATTSNTPCSNCSAPLKHYAGDSGIEGISWDKQGILF